LLNLRSIGFANLINSLAAINDVVYTRKKASLMQITTALRANFEGYEVLRRQLRAAPKLGNNDDRADYWAEVWLNFREDARLKIQQVTQAPMAYEIVVRSLHHLEGKSIGATPDGRKVGQPLADSVGAEQGTTHAGPTALLNSACKLAPARHWGGGYNLNLTLPLTNWNRPEMRAVLVNMLDVFFFGGGQELQINALDACILRDAQAHPENYGDLLVRIAGFNARFIDLSDLEKNELILRAENAQ
jgi:formate C-acetyltransferase